MDSTIAPRCDWGLLTIRSTITPHFVERFHLVPGFSLKAG